MMMDRTAYAARNLFKVLRAVAKVAIRTGMIETDPTTNVRRPKIKDTGGFRCWTDDEITTFEAHFAIGTRERLAFGLLLHTGQRRGDVIRMGRQHIEEGFLAVRQQKTGTVLHLPIIPELREILAAQPAEHLTFLVTTKGQPFSPAGFTAWFCAACAAAGLSGLSAHGLRKAMCRRLAEAGRSANEIAAVSGHKSLPEVARYTKAADQKRMASAAMADMNKGAAKVANLPATEVANRRSPRGKKP